MTLSEVPHILNPLILPSEMARGESFAIAGTLPGPISVSSETLALMYRTHLPPEKKLKLEGFPLDSPMTKKDPSGISDRLVFPRVIYSQAVNLLKCLQKIRVFEDGLRAVVTIIQL